jgi:hypothetical protein
MVAEGRRAMSRVGGPIVTEIPSGVAPTNDKTPPPPLDE